MSSNDVHFFFIFDGILLLFIIFSVYMFLKFKDLILPNIIHLSMSIDHIVLSVHAENVSFSLALL